VWINAWSAPQSDAGAVDLDNQTLRQKITVLHAGDQLRIRLSNRYADKPVVLDALHIGMAQGDADVVAGSGRVLRFGGESKLTLAPGASVWSDAVPMKVSSMQPLMLSFHAAGRFTNLSRHYNHGVEPGWVAEGDHADDESAQAFTRLAFRHAGWLLADAADVATQPGARVVVVFGDSIAKTFVAALGNPRPPGVRTVSLDARYPDLLSARFRAANKSISVVSGGLGGNRLLSTGPVALLGPSGLSRLKRDVLEVSGVTDVVVLIGINDLGLAFNPDAPALIEGLRETTARLRAAGLRVHLGTVMPCRDAAGGAFTPLLRRLGVAILQGRETVDQARQEVNRWIRQASRADRVIDFDACMRNPAAPGHLMPAYDSGDHVHPNQLGYEAMARCVDLSGDH
jgi:lysophospholipase L1-like esterase